MGHQRFLPYPHFDPHTRGLPPTHRRLLPPPAPPGCPSDSVCPTHSQSRSSPTPHFLHLYVDLRSPRPLKASYERTVLVLPTPGLAHPCALSPYVQAPPNRRARTSHYPAKRRPLSLPLATQDAPTRRGEHPLPPTYGTHLQSPEGPLPAPHVGRMGVPPPPPPEFYTYPCRLDPHPFMNLDKVIAGHLYQMRADKSYLSAHPSWWSEDPDTTCPQCRSDNETFKHAILHCPVRSYHRRRYLEPALSLRADSPLWDNKDHLHALSQYLTARRTGFPPKMAPSPMTPLSPPPSLPPLPSELRLEL